MLGVKMKRIAAVMTLLFCSAAMSETPRWIPIGASANGSLLFMERPVTEPVKATPPGFNAYKVPNTTTWVKIVAPEAKTKSGAKPKFASSVQKIEFDCQRRLLATKRAIFYDLDGEVLNEEQAPSARLDEPIPDSIGEGILLAVCTWMAVENAPSQAPKIEKQGATSL